MSLKSSLRGLLPRRSSVHRILTGPLRGLKIATSWHDYPAAILGYTERKLTNWLLENARPGETWLDVGANCGYTSLALSRAVGLNGRVFAFEPALTTTACLEQTGRVNRMPQLIPMPLGLSDSPLPVVSRFVTDRGMIDSQMVDDGHRELTTIVAVALDSIWEGISGDQPRVHGLKIDIQGMELLALRGMRELLARDRPTIVLEIHREVSRDAILSLLEDCGYLLDPEPIDDTLGDFADPESNASFVFKPQAFLRDEVEQPIEPTRAAETRAVELTR